MPKDYIPATDNGLQMWTANLARQCVADPQAYGLTQPIAEAYSALQADFAVKLFAATRAETRGLATVAQKNDVRKRLVAETRTLVRCLQGSLVMTDEKRRTLDLPIRKTTSTPVPASPPLLRIVNVVQRTVTLQLRDADASGRARPKCARGAAIFTFVGRTPPLDPRLWTHHAQTVETTTAITFPMSVESFSDVWISAAWVNTTAKLGPGCQAVPATLGGGYGPMRLAKAA